MYLNLGFTFNGVEYRLTPAVGNTLLFVLILCIVSIVIGSRVKKADFREKPKGLVLIAEIFVTTIENLTINTMGKANYRFAPYIGALATYLAVANLSGLLGFVPPTSDYNVTLGLSLITFFLIHFNNIRFNGIKNYVKGYFEPMAFLFPINLLGEIATPISLSFRLLGNILSGAIIMSLVYGAFKGISVLLAPILTPFLHAYFDIFSGVLQTFIFIMLTMVFISNGIGDREEIE